MNLEQRVVSHSLSGLSLPLNVLSTASVLPGTHTHAINKTCTEIWLAQNERL